MGVETALIGGAVLGGLAGSQEQGGGTSTQTSNPWEPQQEFLKYGFGQAQDAYKNAIGMGAYTGQRVAGLNPFQTQGANFTGGYASGLGQQGANLLGSSGLSMLQQGQGFGQNANSIYSLASQDPTQQILATAGQYANNPYADGMIDAANRDTMRMLNEQEMPTLYRNAAGTGNTNNTRVGQGSVADAVLQRGAADRMNATAANIRGSLFNTGLSQGQNQYNQNLQNMLAANSDLLNAFNYGGSSIIQGQQASGNNFDQLNAAGGLFQNQNQNELTAAQQQFAEQRDLPMQLAAGYQQTVGGNYGGTQTTTMPSTGGGFGGMLTGALGGGLAAAGTFGKLGGFNTPAPAAPYTVGAGGFGTGANYSFGSGLRFGR